jgi:hypothetical protein
MPAAHIATAVRELSTNMARTARRIDFPMQYRVSDSTTRGAFESAMNVKGPLKAPWQV